MKNLDLNNFQVNNEGIFKIVESKGETNLKRIANPAYVEEVVRDIEKDTISLSIRYFNYGDWKSHQFDQGKLSRNHLEIFMNRGLDISNTSQDDVFNCLLQSAQEAKIRHSHSNLGWIDVQGKPMYRLKNIITSEDLISNYTGDINLEPRGSLEDWLAAIESHVEGHAPLELALSIGFAASLVGWYGIDNAEKLDSILFHLVGNSSMGKSTAASLAVSPFARPSNDGLIKSFNGTPNALEHFFSGNYGVPLVLDETSMHSMSTRQLSTFIYKIAENRGKGRLTKEAKSREIPTWATLVLMTGEGSLLNETKAHVGLQVRLFELNNIAWTKSAQHAEALNASIQRNYGTAGPIFIKHLLRLGKEKIDEKYLECKADLMEALPHSKYRDRIANKFAFILLATKLANESLDLSLSTDQVKTLLVQQEEDSLMRRDLAKLFHHKLKAKIIEYIGHFKFNNSRPASHKDIYGKITAKGDDLHIYLLESAYKKIAKELRITNTDVLLNELKSNSYLKHDQNKRKIRTSIDGSNVYTICVHYDHDFLSEFIPSYDLDGFSIGSAKANGSDLRKPKDRPRIIDEKPAMKPEDLFNE